MSKADTFGFTGPAIAASAISLLIPLVEPKESPIKIEGHSVQTLGQKRFTPIVIFLAFLYLLLWCFSCYIAITTPNEKLFYIETHLFIALGMYALAAILGYVKDYI